MILLLQINKNNHIYQILIKFFYGLHSDLGILFHAFPEFNNLK